MSETNSVKLFIVTTTSGNWFRVSRTGFNVAKELIDFIYSTPDNWLVTDDETLINTNNIESIKLIEEN